MRWLVLLLIGCAQVEQSASCATYVSCVQAQDAIKGIETDVVRFEPGGACWINPDAGALCDRGCTNGMLWIQETGSDLPEECAS